MSLLKAEGLGIDFGGNAAVDDVGFEVQQGQIVSIIGPNGAGKTTLFNMLSGLYMPMRGRVFFDGEDVTKLRADRLCNLGMARTFQNLALFAGMTALENVMAGAHRRQKASLLHDLFHLPATRRDTRHAEEIARPLLAQLGLSDIENIDATSLPYGQMKRLEIARALASNPRLLLLDEPAAGCNPVETGEIDEVIVQVARQGIAVLLVEHDMKLVMNVSDEVIALDRGRMIAAGQPREVAVHPDVVAAYLGTDAEKVKPDA